jgi:hypothetical protein
MTAKRTPHSSTKLSHLGASPDSFGVGGGVVVEQLVMPLRNRDPVGGRGRTVNYCTDGPVEA